MRSKKRVKIGIVGCGAIGEGVALFINKQLSNEVHLLALADLDKARAEKLSRKITPRPQICDIDRLIKKVDLVIETASAQAARSVLVAACNYKKDLMLLSVGALIHNFSLLRRAIKLGLNVYVPSGAISGVDGLGAFGLATIRKVSLTTSKPPKGLIGASYLKEKKINLNNLRKPKLVFKGSVKEAVKHFPKNINVAATIYLATAFKKVEVCIMADPKLKRNVHSIRVEAKEGNLDMRIENFPSKSNPKTSAMTIFSTQNLLKKLFSPFKIGS